MRRVRPSEKTRVPHDPPTARRHRARRLADPLCIAAILLAALGIYSPALFGGKVLLPADTVLLMRPWGVHAVTMFPEFRRTQNQMHGPIFEYYSWRQVARTRLRQGEVPLWNPYELGGNVLLANSQSAVLYPPNVLLDVLPLPVGINWVTALHTFLTGLLLFLFLRSASFPPPAALTGALIWMLCGVQTSWTEFQTPTAALCWLPGLLLCWQRTRRGGSMGWVLVGGSVCVALTLLAGHLQFAFYVLLAYVVFALLRGGITRRGAALLCACLMLGIGLSMCTLLPVVEMGRHNFRAVHDSYSASVALRLPPENLLTLLLPNVLGNPRDHTALDADGSAVIGTPYRGEYDFIEYSSYLGVVGLALAAVGVFALLGHRGRRSRSRRTAAALGGIALVGLLLALGTPLCAVLFYGAPGYRQFNATARALCLFSFGMSVLAAYGVQFLGAAGQRAPGRSVRIAALACCAVGVAVVAAYLGMMGLRPDLFAGQWSAYQASGLRHALACVALTLIVSAYRRSSASPRRGAGMVAVLPFVAASDLIVAQFGFNPVTSPEYLGFATAVTDFLRGVQPDRVASLEAPNRGTKSFIVPNYNATYGIREVQGADSLHTRRYHRWIEHIVLAADPHRAVAFPDPNTIHIPGVAHAALDALNVRYVTTFPGIVLPADRFEKVLDAELTVWRNRMAAGPAWLAPTAEPVRDLDRAFSAMSEPGFSPLSTAVVEGDTAGVPRATRQTTSLRDAGAVTVAAFTPHEERIDVAGSGGGMLVASEIAMPGWRATVNGVPTPIRVADGVLRAVPVSAGKSTVVFRYDPASYRVGLYLTVWSVALVAGLSISLRRGRAAGPIGSSVRL